MKTINYNFIYLPCVGSTKIWKNGCNIMRIIYSVFFTINSLIRFFFLFFLCWYKFIALQDLLEPIVSQLTVEPPASLEEHPDIPSVQEVDDLLVSCIGQMAVTAGSDLLWKPLNHEVSAYSLYIFLCCSVICNFWHFEWCPYPLFSKFSNLLWRKCNAEMSWYLNLPVL